ncbi:MAG: zinc-ribbon domain-containing protein, partial [Oscillospiraceae bacterium]|nr:zinc-ribbon domain-containing protein [Oscillospiraceae bacterium]
MNTFDSFMNKAREVADAAAQKTGEVLEVSKLKLQEVKLTNDINKAFCELGSLYYNSVKFGGGNEEQMNAAIARLDKMMQEQDELKNNASNVGHDHKRYCTACGHENSATSLFCARCGNSLSGT